MIYDVGNKATVRAGDLVRIVAKLPADCPDARLSIWSATKGFDLSPHIQHAGMGLVQEGKPSFVSPMRFTLNKKNTRKVIEFIADEDLIIRVRQERDEDLPSAKVKVRRYGKAFQKIRSRIRNAIRSLRNLSNRRNEESR